jgi:uncharacterized protein involved in exopolysaccharide biosynthesis
MTDPTESSEQVHGYDTVALLAPLLENWRGLAGFVLLVGAAVAGFVIAQPRKHRAEVIVATVARQQTISALGGLAATLTGANLQGGVQLTPARMVELMRSRRVLTTVGSMPAPSAPELRIGDVLAQERVSPANYDRIQRRMSEVVSVDLTKETGTITVRVEYKDTAVARAIAAGVVKEAGRAFVEIARAQATQLRLAQTARVDSARRQLTGAEQDLANFLGSNRVVNPYAGAAVARQRLERNVTFAQQVYTQAITDREAAVAKELEETPAVVVVDSMPEVLPKVRRRLIMKTGVALVAALVAGMCWILLREYSRRRLAREDVDAQRLVSAARSLPLAGRRLFRVAR